MTITIDRTVFDSASAYQNLQVEALIAAEKVEAIAAGLMQAANKSYPTEEQSISFQPLQVSFEPNEPSAGLKDFAIAYQDLDEKGVVSDVSLLDLSFAVTNDRHGHMVPGAMLRFGSSMKPPENADEAPSFHRHPSVDDFIHADHATDVGNKIFSWIFTKLPENQHAAFLKNCEEAGLVEQQNATIGFGIPTLPEPQPKAYSDNDNFEAGDEPSQMLH